MGIEARFRERVEQSTGLEAYNLNMREGLSQHTGAVLLKEGKIVPASKVKDTRCSISEIEKIQGIVGDVLLKLKEESASWHRCLYVQTVMTELQTRVNAIGKRLSHTAQYESVHTQLVSLSTDTKAVTNFIDTRMGLLSQDASISTMFSSLPILPDWKYEDFFGLYYFIKELWNVSGYSEYSQQNKYGKTDIVLVRGRIWVLAVAKDDVRVFMDWQDQSLIITSGSCHTDPLKLFRKHPETTNFSSVDHVIQVGLAYVRGYGVFHEKKTRVDGKPQIVVAVPASIGEYMQITPSENFVQQFKAWISSALNASSIEALPDASFFKNLSDAVTVGEIERELVKWEGLESKRKTEENIAFYNRIGTGILEHIPRIQAFMTERLRSSLTVSEPTSLGLYDWLLAYVGYHSSSRLSVDEVAMQESLREAHRLFIFFLRSIVEIEDQDQQATALRQLISIYESVIDLLQAGLQHQNYQEVHRHHMGLRDTMLKLRDWQVESIPSFVRVAYEYYRQKHAAVSEHIQSLFPVLRDDKRELLRLAIWIKLDSRIAAVYKWRKQRFYCIKLRDLASAEREKKWLPQLACGVKKVKSVAAGILFSCDSIYKDLPEGFTVVGGMLQHLPQESVALLTELVLGTNLEAYVTQRPSISHQERLEIFLKVAKCLLELHERGAVFRDLKLEQFVRQDDGSIVLVDGESIQPLGREEDDDPITTPIFLAPEMLRPPLGTFFNTFEDFIRSRQFTKENDIWMLGWIAYAILVKVKTSMPFESHYRLFANNPTMEELLAYSQYLDECVQNGKHWERLPELNYWFVTSIFAQFVNQLIGRMLHFNPNERPSIDQVVEELEVYLGAKYSTRSADFKNAAAKFKALLAELASLPPEEKEPAVQRARSIYRKVVKLLQSDEMHPDASVVSAYHQKLWSTLQPLQGWEEVRVPSFVDVAFLYYQLKEQGAEKVPYFFPMERRGEDDLLQVGKRKGREGDVKIVFRWNEQKFYCEKRRSEIGKSREETWFPSISAAPKAIQSFKMRDGSFVVSTDFIEGPNLREYLAGKKLTEQEALALILKAARCLQEVHQKGGVFGDFTAGQFIVRKDGSICLIDGESITGKDEELDGLNPITTYALAPPEVMKVYDHSLVDQKQFEESRYLTQKSDLWMLGWLIYQICENPSVFPPHTGRYGSLIEEMKTDAHQALIRYSEDFERLVQDKKHYTPLTETSYWLWSSPFAKFINRLLSETLVFNSKERVSVNDLIKEIEEYQRSLAPSSPQ